MDQDFSGKTALITGAARGLGRAAAVRFLERGATVAVHVRDIERAEAVARQLGAGAFPVAGDIADSTAVREIVDRTLDRCGRLDILVNNAALALSARFEKISEEEWRRAMDVNVTAPFLLIRAVLPR
jgi:NAD(P)-dependent dehydrogenase (short-subunit alcohol dehydrogenase family)